MAGRDGARRGRAVRAGGVKSEEPRRSLKWLGWGRGALKGRKKLFGNTATTEPVMFVKIAATLCGRQRTTPQPSPQNIYYRQTGLRWAGAELANGELELDQRQSAYHNWNVNQVNRPSLSKLETFTFG